MIDDSAGSKVRNDLFDRREGLDRGRSKLVEAAWYGIKIFFFLSALPWPSGLKRGLLRLFGATIGRSVVIKPRVNIHFPWKLEVGDFTWLGEDAWLLNFEPLRIGRHCCISQRAFLCGGNHDFRTTNMRYRNGPITVNDGAWIGAQVFVAPNVSIGVDAVVVAGTIVTCDVPAGMVWGGQPAGVLTGRWLQKPGAQ